MHPTLFSLFGYDVSSYMLLIAVGFVFATAMGAIWVRRVGQNPDVIVDLGLASVVAGLVGARLLHVLADGYFWDYVHLCTDPGRVSWPVLKSECLGRLDGVWDAEAAVCHPKQADCWSWAQIWGGGLTFYGGFVAATLAAAWLFRRDRFPFCKGLDMGGMMVPIGLGLGRLGCVMVGCCFGKACDLPWALSFPSHSPASEWQFRQKLLATPVVEGNVPLASKSVAYEFADPRLQSLSSAQRQLLRMGPRNVQLIQAKLREIASLAGLNPAVQP